MRYTTYIPVALKEIIYKYVPTPKTIHILYYEQTVCRRGTKWNKTYLTNINNINMRFYLSMTGSHTTLLFKEQRQKIAGNRFLELSCDTLQDPN